MVLHFQKTCLWTVWKDHSAQRIALFMHYPDGFQGFPGNVKITVTYTLTDDNAIEIHYEGTPGWTQVINMTNHSYFNLDGHETGSILTHQVRIDADAFTRTDAQLIPTGEIVDVTGTPMDFRTMKAIGQDIQADFQRFPNSMPVAWITRIGAVNAPGTPAGSWQNALEQSSGRRHTPGGIYRPPRYDRCIQVILSGEANGKAGASLWQIQRCML